MNRNLYKTYNFNRGDSSKLSQSDVSFTGFFTGVLSKGVAELAEGYLISTSSSVSSSSSTSSISSQSFSSSSSRSSSSHSTESSISYSSQSLSSSSIVEHTMIYNSFTSGTFVNTVSYPYNPGDPEELRLGPYTSAGRYMWIPCASGYVSKVDISDPYRPLEVGRYATGVIASAPSRIAIDAEGHCWVGNRESNPPAPHTSRGTVLKIGNSDFGQWRDWNGNGTIDTSYVYPNGSLKYYTRGEFKDPSIGGKIDECILANIRFRRYMYAGEDGVPLSNFPWDETLGYTEGSSSTESSQTDDRRYYTENYPMRGIVVDNNGNVWLGNSNHYYLDRQGIWLKVTPNNVIYSYGPFNGYNNLSAGTYGAVCDKHGIIWSVGMGSKAGKIYYPGRIDWFDSNDPSRGGSFYLLSKNPDWYHTVGHGGWSYGITVSDKYVWVGSVSAPSDIARIDSDAFYASYRNGDYPAKARVAFFRLEYRYGDVASSSSRSSLDESYSTLTSSMSSVSSSTEYLSRLYRPRYILPFINQQGREDVFVSCLNNGVVLRIKSLGDKLIYPDAERPEVTTDPPATLTDDFVFHSIDVWDRNKVTQFDTKQLNTWWSGNASCLAGLAMSEDSFGNKYVWVLNTNAHNVACIKATEDGDGDGFIKFSKKKIVSAVGSSSSDSLSSSSQFLLPLFPVEASGHYNYTNFTGYKAFSGDAFFGVWTGIFDSGRTGTRWYKVTTTSEVDEGAYIRIVAGAGNIPETIAASQEVQDGIYFDSPLLGRYLKVIISLNRNSDVSTPKIYELALTYQN